MHDSDSVNDYHTNVDAVVGCGTETSTRHVGIPLVIPQSLSQPTLDF